MAGRRKDRAHKHEAGQKPGAVARSVRMTLSFYKSHGVPGPARMDAGGKAPIVTVYDFGAKLDHYESYMKVYFPDPNFEQPPARLERSNGISGIGRQYRLPAGLDAPSIQNYACILRRQQISRANAGLKADTRMLRLWRELEKLNPSLRKLAFDRKDPKKVSDAVWGVASAFNPADLQFFLKGNTWGGANESPAYKARIDKLQGALKDGYVGWVAAPRTLTSIWNKVQEKKRNAEPAASARLEAEERAARQRQAAEDLKRSFEAIAKQIKEAILSSLPPKPQPPKSGGPGDPAP